MAATIIDIKNMTGLSLATISKFLNGGNVLPKNRVLIENAINELHYEVNEIARGLVTNKTRTIGVIVHSIDNLFSGTLLHHIGGALREKGYGLLICDSCNDTGIESTNVKFLLNKKVDGIIVIPVSHTSDFLAPAKNANIPVVLLDRALDDIYDCVGIDNELAASNAVNLLIKNNHRDIAVICSDETEYTGNKRYLGYEQAMLAHDLKLRNEFIKRGTHSIEFGYNSMKQFIQMDQKPTAVFMSNYELTLGAVMAVNESKFKCPQDISLIGVDDLILSHVVKPRLYMVVQPMKEMGEKSVELLLNHIQSKNEEKPKRINLSTWIHQGDSIQYNK